jgi:ADP-ribose pyrophosphatase YjhB (NUDIX family)
MSNFGATIAIIQEGRVLLIKREDFEVWGLPAGMNDPGESIAQTALREAWEETGLRVELTRLVGVYSTHYGQQYVSHSILFAARPVGGTLQPQVNETLDLAYFAPDELPEFTMWWHHQPIHAALNGIQGVVWQTNIAVAKPFQTREELYQFRDSSGLTRQEFYRYYFKEPESQAHIQEVGWGLTL